MKIKFVRSWCDYLTDCPNKMIEASGEIIKVGSYECAQCPFYVDGEEEAFPPMNHQCDYQRYQTLTRGCVNCSYNSLG